MRTFQQFESQIKTVPLTTSWYLADLGEMRGRQALFTNQSPQKLKALREHALIESTVSSNRITVSDLERAGPSVSRDMVRRILRQLKEVGRVEPLGRGPGAQWQRRDTTLKKR